MNSWIDFAINVCMLTAAVIGVFEGMRRITSEGINRKRVLVVAGGLLWCLSLSGMQFFVSTMNSLKLPPTSVVEFSSELCKKLGPSQCEESSRMQAGFIYQDSGKLTDFVEASGTRKKFDPTQSDLKNREERITLYHQLDSLAQSGFSNGVRLILLPLFALLFGLLVGRDQRLEKQLASKSSPNK